MKTEIKTAVTKEELERRRDAMVEAINRDAIELAIITTPESILYLTGIEVGGFWSLQAVLLNSAGEHTFVVRKIEMHWEDLWAPQTWCNKWRSYSDEEPASAVVASAARDLCGGSPGRVGMELDRRSVSYETVQEVASAVGPTELVTVAPLVEKLRMIKSPPEIALIKEASRISRAGNEEAAEAVRHGASDAEAVSIGLTAMYREGSDFVALGPLVATGPESAMAHPPWRRTPPEEGELITIETCASVKRYQGPVERTYVKGSANSQVAKMFGAIISSTNELVNNVKPGMTSHDADKLARDVLVDAGLGEYFINRAAYSIGLAFPPVWWENDIMQMRQNDERVLEPGMAFHLVPGLHVPGVGYMIRSRTIVVTETGVEPLSDMPLEVEPL
jgi:Xaa-Pro dipeptidase